MEGREVSSKLGVTYNDFLSLLPGTSKNADLVAHFFRRAAVIAGANGTFGLIATNTISQGETRAAGLQKLRSEGGTIYDATTALQWPGSAAVTVSVVHLALGNVVARVGTRYLDEQRVSAISSRLEARPERADPASLHANAGISFLGLKPWGTGFLLSSDERAVLVAKDSRNAERTFRYVGGEDVNTSPDHLSNRFAIHFGAMDLVEAERWPDLMAIVRERVKPERDRLGDSTDARRMKQYWWQYYGRDRPELMAALARVSRVLVLSRHTKHACLAFCEHGNIFSEAVYLFALDSFASFATLQSRIHEPWARLFSSSLEDRLRYSASDCFETFPFPRPDPRTVMPTLEIAGEALYEARARFMIDADQGLTRTYNALKDASCEEPRILGLRRLHEALDRAVLDAYGWTDLEVPRYCPRSDADRAAVRAFEHEVIDRLYVLNAERAREEQRLGTRKSDPTRASPSQESPLPDAAPNKTRASKKSPKEQGKLFDS
jgi:hypothetical protein